MNEATALASGFAGLDADLHGRVAGDLRRIPELIGLERGPRVVEGLEAETKCRPGTNARQRTRQINGEVVCMDSEAR